MADELFDFKWRYKSSLNSTRAVLLKYVQNRNLHPTQSKTETILNALTAYYMLPALKSSGNCSQETLELVRMDSLRALMEQFKYLCAVQGVDVKQMVALFLGETVYVPQPDFPKEDEPLVETWDLSGMMVEREIYDEAANS